MFCFRTVHLLSRTYFFSSQPIWYTKQEAVSRRRFATMQKGEKTFTTAACRLFLYRAVLRPRLSAFRRLPVDIMRAQLDIIYPRGVYYDQQPCNNLA